MRRIIRHVPVIAIVVFASYLSVVVLAEESAPKHKIWTVDATGGGDTKTISEALTMAKEGDTVSVQPGVYRELLNLKSGVSIVGVDPAQVIVEYERDEAVVVGKGINAVTIQGMTLQHEAGTAPCGTPVVVFDDCAHMEISGNIILGSGYIGVKASSCSGLNLHSNTIAENSWLGVVVSGCKEVVLVGNEIRDNKITGVSIVGSDAIVMGNRITGNNKYGVLVGRGSGTASRATIDGNLISGSRVAILEVTHPDENQIQLGTNECSDNEFSLLAMALTDKQMESLDKWGNRAAGFYLNYFMVPDRAIRKGGCSP